MMLVSPPAPLDLDEAEAWLRSELAPLIASPGLRSGVLSRLSGAPRGRTQDWAWLVELEFVDVAAAHAAMAAEACALLLGDLRLLGMRPTVALIVRTDELRL